MALEGGSVSSEPVSQLSHRAKLFQARADLVDACPFLGFLALKMPVLITNDGHTTTASVDGRGVCRIDQTFLDSLRVSDLKTVLLHEVLHLALDAFGRQNARDPWLWNVAHDHAVNLLIEEVESPFESAFTWPDGIQPLMDKAFKGLSAEVIYEKLLGKARPVSVWLDLRPGETIDSDLGPRWHRHVVAAWEQARLQGGRTPPGIATFVKDLLQPKLPWQQILAHRILGRIAGHRRTFARPSRRGSALGLILPGKRPSEGVVGVFVDVSGSISEGDRTAFLSEVAGILEQTNAQVRLLAWDYGINFDGLLEQASDLRSTLNQPLCCGGGTEPELIIEHLFTSPEDVPLPAFAVILTDGCCEWPPVDAWPLEPLILTTDHHPSPELGYEVISFNPSTGVHTHA